MTDPLEALTFHPHAMGPAAVVTLVRSEALTDVTIPSTLTEPRALLSQMATTAVCSADSHSDSIVTALPRGSPETVLKTGSTGTGWVSKVTPSSTNTCERKAREALGRCMGQHLLYLALDSLLAGSAKKPQRDFLTRIQRCARSQVRAAVCECLLCVTLPRKQRTHPGCNTRCQRGNHSFPQEPPALFGQPVKIQENNSK